jgi:hypothetical protein
LKLGRAVTLMGVGLVTSLHAASSADRATRAMRELERVNMRRAWDGVGEKRLRQQRAADRSIVPSLKADGIPCRAPLPAMA